MEYRCTLGRVEVGWRGVEPDDLSLLCIIIHWSGGGGGRSLEVCSKGGRGSCSTSWCVSSFRRILLEFRPMLTIAEHPLTHISPPHPPLPLFFFASSPGELVCFVLFFYFFLCLSKIKDKPFQKACGKLRNYKLCLDAKAYPSKTQTQVQWKKKNTAKLIQN